MSTSYMMMAALITIIKLTIYHVETSCCVLRKVTHELSTHYYLNYIDDE